MPMGSQVSGLKANKDRAGQRMLSALDTMQRCDEKVQTFTWARAACKALPLLVALFSFPASVGIGETMKVIAILPPPTKAPSPYHTLTAQCPYPGSSSVNLIMASTKGSFEQKAINNLKNCLEPPNLQWTAEI
jgi:hypothetical protein